MHPRAGCLMEIRSEAVGTQNDASQHKRSVRDPKNGGCLPCWARPRDRLQSGTCMPRPTQRALSEARPPPGQAPTPRWVVVARQLRQAEGRAPTRHAVRHEVRERPLDAPELADHVRDGGLVDQLHRLRNRRRAYQPRRGVRRPQLRHLIAYGHQIQAGQMGEARLLRQQLSERRLLPHHGITGELPLKKRPRRDDPQALEQGQEAGHVQLRRVPHPSLDAVCDDERLCNTGRRDERRLRSLSEALELGRVARCGLGRARAHQRVVPIKDDNGPSRAPWRLPPGPHDLRSDAGRGRLRRSILVGTNAERPTSAIIVALGRTRREQDALHASRRLPNYTDS
mmetsp:Transcript_68841/g.193075  ORF Transcript_68841/g.193075 Transcript_68841/m.193075 type:complete len:340 (-) Transcript_68841:24-1043(-)